jgi:hypothetical protein
MAFFMEDYAVPRRISKVDALKRMSMHIRAGDPPGTVEIEQALEGGFGRLIGLEAELLRIRERPSAGPEDATRLDDLQREIAVLRDVLTELRTLSSSPGSPRIGYGFVLPGSATTPPSSADPQMPRRF